MRMFETFAVTRRVEVMGRGWAVRPLRLRDLAQIEAWVADRTPCPLDGGRAALRAADPSRRPKLAARMLAGAEAAMPEMGSDAYEDAVNTPDGILLFLTLALRDSGVSGDELADLVVHLVQHPDDLERLRSVAYGVNPVQYLVRIMEGTQDMPGHRTWGETVMGLLKERPAWTLGDVGDLTLSQWACVQSEGKGGVDLGNVPPRPGETLEQMSERRRKLFEPDPDPEPEAAGDA